MTMIEKKWIPHTVQREVVLASKGRCYHCETKAARAGVTKRGLPMLYDAHGETFNFDHLKPRILGGKSTQENVVLSCPSCNRHRGRQNLAHKERIDSFVKRVNGSSPSSATLNP